MKWMTVYQYKEKEWSKMWFSNKWSLQSVSDVTKKEIISVVLMKVDYERLTSELDAMNTLYLMKVFADARTIMEQCDHFDT